MARELYRAALAVAENGSPIQAANFPNIDYNQDHMLVIGDYDDVLHDYLKRDFSIGVKVNSVRAKGYPHVWNEQKEIPQNTQAIDPQIGFGTATAPSYRPPTLSTTYNRDNWQQAFCRAYATGIRYDFFTREMEKNYGTFEDLTAKDYNDMFVDFVKTTCNDFWNGTTPYNTASAATGWTYYGVLAQITDRSVIATGTTIADALVTKITSLMARLDYAGYPDVICMNPATYDILLKEELQRNVYSRPVETEIIPGIRVPAFYTPMGLLPVNLTPFIKPDSTSTPGKTIHTIACINTKMIDRIWMFNDGPKVYEIATPDMPLANDRLLTDKFVLDFANYIVHGPQTGAHFILTKEV